MLNLVADVTHECLAIRINRKLKAFDVIDVLSDVFNPAGTCRHASSEANPEPTFVPGPTVGADQCP
jgi:putative transposase